MIAQVNLPIFAKNGRNNLAQDPYALQQYLTSLLQPIDRNVHDMFTKEQSFILAADDSDATLVFQIGALTSWIQTYIQYQFYSPYNDR